jgi:hypothetical protein
MKENNLRRIRYGYNPYPEASWIYFVIFDILAFYAIIKMYIIRKSP